RPTVSRTQARTRMVIGWGAPTWSRNSGGKARPHQSAAWVTFAADRRPLARVWVETYQKPLRPVMTLPKKNSRTLTVDAARYRWLVSVHQVVLHLTVESADEPGQTLQAFFQPHDQFT